MSRSRIAALLPLLALVVMPALSACTASGQTEAPTVQSVAVAVTEAQTGRLTATSQSSGQLEPILSVTVTAKVPGRVLAVHREMGDAVKAGDLLLELEDRDLANQSAAAQAQYTQAEAQWAEAARQASRLEVLLAEGAVSQQQAEQIRTQLTLASAQVEAARAQLDLASASLEEARVTAPADGVLSARYAEPGTMVGAGTPLFQLVDLSTVVVDTGVAEAAINVVQPGTEVQVRVSSLDRTFTGSVQSVSPQMDQQSRSYKVRVLLPNPDGVLKGGMFAEVQFPLEEREGVLVPVDAVVEGSGEPYLYVVEDGVARRATVTIGVRSDQQLLVEGVSAGDQVVTVGQNRLYDGAPVQIGDQIGGGPDR